MKPNASPGRIILALSVILLMPAVSGCSAALIAGAGIKLIDHLRDKAEKKAIVEVPVLSEPNKGLPPDLKTIAVLPPQTKEFGSSDWSDILNGQIEAHLVEYARRSGTGLKVIDRQVLRALMDEQEMTVVGVLKEPAERSIIREKLGVQAFIYAEARQDVDKNTGKERHFNPYAALASPGHAMESVETIRVDISASSKFRMVLTGSGEVYHSLAHPKETVTQEIVPAEGDRYVDLDPVTTVLREMLDRQLRQFLADLIPTEVYDRHTIEVHKDDARKTVLADLNTGAGAFQEARQWVNCQEHDDHKMWFAMGLACEMTGLEDPDSDDLLRKALECYEKARHHGHEDDYSRSIVRVRSRLRRWAARGDGDRSGSAS